MKKIISRIKALKIDIQKEVLKREQYFLGRTEKWQESEKADLYSVDTENLRALGDNLDEGLSGLD